ncbi:hypothetical protein L1887_20482 [Cichorium endivia]|nr:hypothetical protein L1887_20482 [Cichorium endivia]
MAAAAEIELQVVNTISHVFPCNIYTGNCWHLVSHIISPFCAYKKDRRCERTSAAGGSMANNRTPASS